MCNPREACKRKEDEISQLLTPLREAVSYFASQMIFLGFKQIREGVSNKRDARAGDLDTSGVLNIVRHPWYLATILLIWARNLDISTILVNALLTCYLIVGAHLYSTQSLTFEHQLYII
jgi:protein-S-isoprenylcysteine O-methyltransferase Ste14